MPVKVSIEPIPVNSIEVIEYDTEGNVLRKHTCAKNRLTAELSPTISNAGGQYQDYDVCVVYIDGERVGVATDAPTLVGENLMWGGITEGAAVFKEIRDFLAS